MLATVAPKKKFEALNPYDKKTIPGSILRIEDINFDSAGVQRQLYGYGISAKRYSLYSRSGSHVRLVKVSEHGFNRHWDARQMSILDRALGFSCQKPDWFSVPVMRRIAISTPNVMAALRRLNRDQARPYNFALSPVLVNLTNLPITLLGPFEKDSACWGKMPYINIHDGSTQTLNPPSLPVLPQTFEMVFSQYLQHPEYKSLAPE